MSDIRKDLNITLESPYFDKAYAKALASPDVPEWLTEGEDFRLLPLALEEVKGLEFDVVLLMEPTEENYPSEEGDISIKNAKLLYVAATRALHELHVLSSGKFSKLLPK